MKPLISRSFHQFSHTIISNVIIHHLTDFANRGEVSNETMSGTKLWVKDVEYFWRKISWKATYYVIIGIRRVTAEKNYNLQWIQTIIIPNKDIVCIINIQEKNDTVNQFTPLVNPSGMESFQNEQFAQWLCTDTRIKFSYCLTFVHFV